MEGLILLTRGEAWDVLRTSSAVVDVAEKAGRDDIEASAAFRLVAVKLLPDLLPDQ